MIHVMFVESKKTVFGGQKALLARCSELRSRGVGFTILHPYFDSAFTRLAERMGLLDSVLRPKARNPRIPMLSLLLQIIRSCASLKPTHIHLDAFDSAYICIVLRCMCLIGGPQMVFTIRSERFLRFNSIDRVLLPLFDHLATNSEYSARSIAQNARIDKDRINVTYSPIDLDKLTQLNKVYIKPLRSLSIGYFGSMEPRKRLDRFVFLALSALENLEKDVRLEMHIYGDAKEKQQAERLVAIRDLITDRGLNGQFTFHGYSDLGKAASTMDVLLCPYDNEPLGRVVPEFLWLGVPVIVNDSGGMLEAGMGAAIPLRGTESEKSVAFVETLRQFVENPDSLSVSLKTREALFSRYAASNVVNQEVQLYCRKDPKDGGGAAEGRRNWRASLSSCFQSPGQH